MVLALFLQAGHVVGLKNAGRGSGTRVGAWKQVLDLENECWGSGTSARACEQVLGLVNECWGL
jgi:hypothetical protein